MFVHYGNTMNERKWQERRERWFNDNDDDDNDKVHL